MNMMKEANTIARREWYMATWSKLLTQQEYDKDWGERFQNVTLQSNILYINISYQNT